MAAAQFLTGSLGFGSIGASQQGQTGTQTTLSNTVPITALDQKHPEWTLNKEAWDACETLYRGGVLIRQQASKFLRKRPKELPDVYAFRCSMFSYENILGSGIDYYLASVFRKQPEIDFKLRGPDGLLYDVTDIPDDARAYYLKFQEDCDTNGTRITDFYRNVLKNMLLYQKSWVLFDLPNESSPVSRWDQQNLMPHLVGFGPQQVTNWGEDEHGNLEWVVIRTETERREWLKPSMKVTRWYKFDQQYYEIYEATSSPGMGNADVQTAKLIDGGFHALAETGKVPVLRVEVPEGLWLANRVLPQVLDHLNSDNSYAFALYMANLAMPVIIGKAQNTITLSEAGYLQLPEGSTLTWTEPVGTSFERSHQRVASLREEIYRAMYLMPQGRSSEATASVQSGYSKFMEMAPSAEIQNLLGDIIRVSMERVLNFAAVVRDDEVVFSVRGFSATLEPALEEIQEATGFMSLNVRSETALKENEKKAIRARFTDASSSMLDKMMLEVDEAPTMAELQTQQDQAQQDQFSQQFQQQTDQQNVQGEVGMVDREQDQAAIQQDQEREKLAIEETKAEQAHKRSKETSALQHKRDLEKLKFQERMRSRNKSKGKR